MLKSSELSLEEILSYVRENSNFYRAKLEGVANDAPLDAVPVTTKADLRRAGSDVLSSKFADAAVYYETTGTTGSPTPCPRSWEDIETSTAPVVSAFREIFARTFANGERPSIALMGPNELYAFGDTFSEVARVLRVSHVKLWPESPRVGFQKALRLLSELGVNTVICAPALAMSLAKAARDYDYKVSDFNIKLFLVLGEVLTDELANNVRSLWGEQASIFNILYGSQECHAIATGCSSNKLHLSESSYIFEVLDGGERETELDGGDQTGELTITMLVPGAKPLIRFRTEDHVTIGSDKDTCGCGSSGRVISVHGRLADKIQLNGQLYWSREVEKLTLHGVVGVFGYTVYLDPENDTLVEIRMDIDERITHLDAVQAKVAENYSAIGVIATVVADQAIDPMNNAASYIGWKAARIRQERAPLQQ